MKKLVSLVFVVALALACSPASPAWAQNMGHMKGGPAQMHGHGGPMAAQLTPDQTQAMQKIMNAHKPTFTKLSQRIWAKNLQLQAALTEDKIDEGKVKALSNEINKLRADLFNDHTAMQLELAKAGLGYYALKGHGMMGQGMMGQGMMGGGMAGMCPMMGGDDDSNGE